MRKSSVVLTRNPYWRTSILQFKGYNDSWDRVVQRSHFFPSRADFAARAVQMLDVCSAIFYEFRWPCLRPGTGHLLRQIQLPHFK
jgi:hypothetical protein